ncbi:MAG: glycosyltransferase [Clostridia bacterium]|nr:glycosyltransferase [Clostridia bacterium]
MTNICFLLGGFQGNGGIGRVTSILVNKLCENPDLNISTISYCQKNQPMLYKLSDKITTHHLFDSSIPMTKAILTKHVIKKIKNIVKKENIDILIACGALFYPVSILACRGTKAKCFCWEHTDPTMGHDHKFQDICRRFAIKRCHKMIVLTKSAERFYLDNLHILADKLCQIYNPISESSDDAAQYNAESKKIISVGRLSYQKNFEGLVEIASKVLPRHPDWTWDIYGEGDYRDMLTEKIEQNGLVGKVNLMGQVNDLYDRYKNYAFMIMTSRYEGFPMALLEGGSNRLPLVSYDIKTGPDEIIEDGKNGFLIDFEDKEKMIERIEQLISDSDLRKSMSDTSYDMIHKFKMDDIIEKWNEVFKKG